MLAKKVFLQRIISPKNISPSQREDNLIHGPRSRHTERGFPAQGLAAGRKKHCDIHKVYDEANKANSSVTESPAFV